MNRLPTYDSKTRRSEWAVYSILGMVAAAMIGLAAWDGVRLARGLDAVAALWTDGPAVAQDGVQRLNQSLTNVSLRPAPVPGGQLPVCLGWTVLSSGCSVFEVPATTSATGSEPWFRGKFERVGLKDATPAKAGTPNARYCPLCWSQETPNTKWRP